MPKVVDGDLSHDRHIRPRRFACRHHRLAQFVQIGEGFKNQQIDARFHQGIRLLAKRSARFGERSRPQRLDTHAQRTHGARHPGRIPGRFARQAYRRPIDRACLFRQTESRQPRPRGAERIRLQNLRAGLHVFLMNLTNHVGRREIQLVETAVDEDAARVEHRPHGPIGDYDSPR